MAFTKLELLCSSNSRCNECVKLHTPVFLGFTEFGDELGILGLDALLDLGSVARTCPIPLIEQSHRALSAR